MIHVELKRQDGAISFTNADNNSLDITGFDPSDLLSAALAKCTESTVRRFAERNEFDLQDLSVRVDYDRDRETKTSHFMVYLKFEGNLSDAELKKLRKSADKSYVRRVLSNPITLKDDVHYNGAVITLN